MINKYDKITIIFNIIGICIGLLCIVVGIYYNELVLPLLGAIEISDDIYFLITLNK